MKLEDKISQIDISLSKDKECKDADTKKSSTKCYECSDFDQSKYTKVRLSELGSSCDKQFVQTFGWVTKCSALKTYTFVELTSEFSTVKLVIPGCHDISFTTSLVVYGVVKAVSSAKDNFTFEISIDKFSIYNGKNAPSFPLNASSEKESRLDNGHLALRMKDRSLFLKVRSALLHCIRDFYYSSKYTEITPPTLVQTQVEGGSTLFEMKYYNEPAYLTQSSQLYLETVVPVTGKAYCIMPSYRAEKSKTSRHLSEYTHVEAELADIDFEDLLSSVESLVRYSVTKFYELSLKDILEVYPDFQKFELSSEPFGRITYTDAIKFLQQHDHMKTDGTPYEYMDDIADASEKFLVATYGKGRPLFMTHFPCEMKSFYMKKVGDGLTESCDLLFPDIGEIVGGSMRLDDAEKLEQAFEREGINPKGYYWYIDMSKYGPSSHGGYGLGFERLLMGLMNYKHVDDATLYPRKVNRCKP